MEDWYYMQGQTPVGPLTEDMMRRLIQTSVIEPNTMVWKPTHAEWEPAGQTLEFMQAFTLAPTQPVSTPPTYLPAQHRAFTDHPVGNKSRLLAGILNFLPGGWGRIYLGYTGVGLTQLLLSCFCVGYAWSIIDGVIILAGAPVTDANGRSLAL